MVSSMQTATLLFRPSGTQASSSVYPREDRPGAEAWAGPRMHLGREFRALGSQSVVYKRGVGRPVPLAADFSPLVKVWPVEEQRRVF